MPAQSSLAPANSSIISISDAYKTFRLDCQSRRIRPRTLKWYEWTLLPFLNWCESKHGLVNLHQISSRHIRAYIVEKQVVDRGKPTERPASLHHTHNVARCIRAFFNFSVREGWLTQSPMKTVGMPKKPKRVLEAYTENEARRLLVAAENDRQKSLVRFLLDTGARAAECAALLVEDIDFENRSARIRDGKGGKERYVYFGAKTARSLDRHLRGKKPWQNVWGNTITGRQLGYRSFVKILAKIGERAKVYCTAHKFRRTFALGSVRNGMEIHILARLMGHEDIEQLKPYLGLQEEDSRKSQQKHGVVDNL